MRAQIYGKDADQIVNVYIRYIMPEILKITVNTKDTWIGLADNGDSLLLDHETRKTPHVCLRTTIDSEYTAELIIFAENEAEASILENHVCYECQNKDQPQFILISRALLLNCAHGNNVISLPINHHTKLT